MSNQLARSYWNATASPSAFPNLSGTLEVDVAIVGGGMVGITTARMLKEKGVTVAVVKARKVGRQVTGKSTAKVTTQHSLRYQTLKSKFGEERTRLYAEAQEVAIREIERLIREFQIDCDFETKAAFVYTCQEDLVAELEKELEVAKSLGLPASNSAPRPSYKTTRVQNHRRNAVNTLVVHWVRNRFTNDWTTVRQYSAGVST
jgi:monoamine oxidase